MIPISKHPKSTPRDLSHSIFALIDRQDLVVSLAHKSIIPDKMSGLEKRLRSIVEYPFIKILGGRR